MLIFKEFDLLVHIRFASCCFSLSLSLSLFFLLRGNFVLDKPQDTYCYIKAVVFFLRKARQVQIVKRQE